MANITVGLDFGTHQTKICIEDKTDVHNPIYSFFPFEDLDGVKRIILPSIIQVNKDNTLSYGFVNRDNCKYGKKFFIGTSPKFPQRFDTPKMADLPEPYKPVILDQKPPSDRLEKIRFQKQYNRALKSYTAQKALWTQQQEAQQLKYKRQIAEMENEYQSELKEWFKWQNKSQANHRLIYRYFKQSTFSDYKWNCAQSSTYLSIWYLSFILFHLEEIYGQDFAIQMGIPTGSDNFDHKKRKAVSLLLTAYHLVEEVFECDLQKFLSTPIQDLEAMTQIIPYSDEKKYEYSLLIFPEAYASLKSLTSQKKIESGMSLMVDIGGGTTDMTFFTVEKGNTKIYDYSSIPFGLNFIAETANPMLQDKFDAAPNLNELADSDLEPAIQQFSHNLQLACHALVNRLLLSFKRTGYPTFKLMDALNNRMVIYSGGGSTYQQLSLPVGTFTDVIHINPKVWEGMTIDEIDKYLPLCPIISTSLGLSISETNDDVELSTVNKIFRHLDGTYHKEERPTPKWV